jgi:hypothetical protein
MLRIVFVVLASALLVGDGLFFGFSTNRWQDSSRLPTAVASVELVPLVIGDWQGYPLPALDDRSVSIAGFAGYFQRRYEKRETSNAVTLLLACGPFGPLCVHSPEVCFGGRGLVTKGSKKLYTEKGEQHLAEGEGQFWTVKFVKPDALVPGQLLVYWAWNAQGRWQAPENPRWTFAGEPVLYKIYVTCEVVGEDDSAAIKTCEDFIHVLLPELEKSLTFKQ